MNYTSVAAKETDAEGLACKGIGLGTNQVFTPLVL